MIELFHPEILFSQDYYTDIYNKILVLSEKKNMKYNIAYSNIKLLCENLIYKLNSNDFNINDDNNDNYLIELFSIKDIVKLCLHPILNNCDIKDKKYSDFNINIDYFLLMCKEYYLLDYEFVDNKLFEFTVKTTNGIEYKINNKYNITHVKFIGDNEFTNINEGGYS